MTDSSDSELEEEEAQHILYDLVTYKEWEQEPEVLKSEKTVRRGRGGPLAVPAEVERLKSLSLTWQLCVSEDANLVAVLGDVTLEIWSSRESYTQLVGRRTVERDPAPHWRHVLWTKDCSLLALADSAGSVELCDTLGSRVYQLISPRIAASQPGWTDTARTGPVSTSYAGVFFTEVRLPDARDGGGWLSELVLVEVSGEVSSFLVSLSGYQELSRYSLGWSVSCASICTRLGILITAAGQNQPFASKRSLVGRASHDAGLVTFRLTNQSPHYVALLETDEQSLLSSPAWLRLPALPFLSSAPSHDFILAMSVSASGGRLAALHVSGSLSIWRLPSLVLESSSRLQEQPLYDEVNPALLQSTNKRKAKAEFLANPVRYHPVSLAWWNEESIVLARVSGAVTVLRIRDNLDNILGESPEFLEGVPRISQCFQKGFFALECDYVVRGRRVSTREESAGEDPDEDLELETDDEEDSWVTLGKRSATALAYFITDSEKFAPPKKKSKIVRRTYRMLALVSTSPEELYKRKILLEEYGEAIMLAQHYGLDTDSVYRRQWQNSNKSTAAIQDYLAKIKRRSEVMRECLETVPDDIDAARELLKYGMRATDLEALVALGQGEEGQLVLSEGEREGRERLRLVSQVRWESLNLTQKELLRSRTKLLYYLDCLDTLEDMLGGSHLAAERYSPAAFRLLRSHSPLENCARAAKQGDTITVECLMSGRHATIISPHWLAVLSSFPETMCPGEYRRLLPSVEGGVVSQLDRQAARPEDWSEGALAVKWGGPGVRRDWDSSVLYRDDLSLQQFCEDKLTPTEVSRWFGHRAKQIVTVTSLPDNGLSLLTLGLERGATVDWQLLHNLRTLDCLVYEVQVQPSKASLALLENMEVLDQMDLLLAGHFTVLGVRRFLQPFLQRLEDGKPGEMRRLVSLYCVAKAAEDLTFPLVVVENSGPDKTGPVLYSVVDTIRLALDCCYTNTTGNQLDLAEKIYLSILPYFKENPGTRQLKYNVSHMKQEVEMFKKHLEIMRILNRNGVVKPLAHLRQFQDDGAAMKKLFDAVTARAEGSRLDQDGWRGVLRDLQKLQSLLPVVNIQSVLLSYTESLLSSGSHTNIALAGTVMEGLIDTADSLKLILTAWRHYYSSASGLHDPDLELARKCLSLAPEGVREVQDCYDLIAALQSLADFGLQDVLPVSVLQCQDRLQFVRRAIQARPTAYRNTQRLMKLASLLKVCGGEAVEGEVWAAVARRAIQVGDLSAAQTASNNLILAGHTRGWDICYALASQASQPADTEQSRDLLAFAVSHCDQENISEVLQAFLSIEQRRIKQQIESSIVRDGAVTGPGNQEDEDEVFDDAVEETEEDRESREREVSPLSTVLNLPKLSSFYLREQQVSPAAVWQQTSSWLSHPAQSQPPSQDQLDTAFTSVSLPAFYARTEGAGSVSGLEVSYSLYSSPAREHSVGLTSHLLLRLNLLSQSAQLLREEEPADQLQLQHSLPQSELLCKALPLLASQDIYLGLGLLLSLPPDLALSCLPSLPPTLPALALALTHLAILHLCPPTTSNTANTVFLSSPRRLVVVALSQGDSSEIYSELVKYQDLLTDYHQGKKLSDLAGEVDVERFTRDQEYKEDTILGLAMLTEADTWRLTLSLARRYSLPLWSVYATHLQTLLTSTLGADMAGQVMRERDILAVLYQDKDRLQEWMVTRVLPLIDGHDIKMLLLYHQILENDSTVAALSLLEEQSLRIDFTVFQRESEEIFRYLSSDNIDTIARVLQILQSSKITPSLVYRDWSFKAFFDHGKSKDNWIEAFSLCQKYMENMNPQDFKLFVKDCILSERILGHIPKPARGRIFKKSVKFVEIQIAAKAEGDWKGLEQWLGHVKLFWEKIKKGSDRLARFDEEYAREVEMFEISGGEDLEICRLVTRLLLQGTDMQFLSAIIQIWKDGEENEGFSETLQAVVDQVAADGDRITEDPFKFIEIICQLEIISNTELSNKLSPLCTNETVPLQERLALVKTLKKLKVELEAEDDLDSSMLASLFETQHQIEKILPGFVVTKADLVCSLTKWSLFEKISAECNSSQQLLELYTLIGNWENFESEFSEDKEKNCVLKLSLKLLQLDNGKDILKLFEKFESNETVPPHVSNILVEKCRSSENRLLFMKIVLQLQLEEHYAEVLEILSEEGCECPDLACVGLLVSRGLISSLVPSPVFPLLVLTLVEHDQLAQDAVEQLQQTGHLVQAASIEGARSGVPLGLRTLVSVAQQIFNKK